MLVLLKNVGYKVALVTAGIACLLICSACLKAVTPTVVLAVTASQSSAQIRTSTSSATLTQTLTPRTLPTSTLTPTRLQITPPNPTFTQIPTYTILRAQVLVRSNCRYGPGAPYLYKYGLVPGSNLEVIGRNDLGTWILVRAIGGTNPCWVKASLMDIKGDVLSVEPTYIPLPQSPYYAPLRGVIAQRDGDAVTISWRAVQFRPGDETASPPYLVEAWVCRGGKIVFIPVGVYQNTVVIQDEAGCQEPSRAQVLLAEKHGYTRPVEVLWPPNEAQISR